MILLQETIQANDIMFRITDVIFIISGVITLLTAWFKFEAAQKKTNDRIDLEVLRGDDKRKAIMREFEMHVEKHKALEGILRETRSEMTLLETDLGKKIDGIATGLGQVNLNIANMKSEILQRLLDKKN